MLNPKQKLFRQESLAHLSSPERLDQLMQVVAPRDWVVLAALGSLVAVAVGWSIWGRIPITVTGRGVLLYPNRTNELQTPVAGQLKQLKIKPGDRVRRGEVIGFIDRLDIRKEIQQQTSKLRTLEQQNQQLATLNQQRSAVDIQVLQEKRQTLEQMLQDKQEISPTLRTTDLLTIQKQRQTLQQTLQDKQALVAVLKQQLDNRKQLQREGAISADRVLEATQAYQANLQQISSLNAQVQELRSKEVTIEQTYRTTQGQIADLQTQIQDLQSQEKNLAQRSLESTNTRTNQIQEVKQKIAQLTLQLRDASQIISQHDGRVLELSARPGQVLNAGVRLGLIETTATSRQLATMVYFPIKDGKRIQSGMTLQITPDIVKRERFGGIIGEVQAISAFPVSQQSILSTVGNAEVAESLTFQGGQVEVLATLNPDPSTYTGYQWSSSRGPQVQLSPGTTASVRVTVDQQAPITFVLPILRSLTNIN
ncbi:MAG: NHLP bacteriocin system secretion protein [Leptolyngbyaceae cyanobacterium bins.302]|nr:NHLP bacteriocin system secretion protein [Leptolyngbyaceae cyanobacterium bins.302]